MIDGIFALAAWMIRIGVGVVIALILLRLLIKWLNLNPFGTLAYHVLRLTEPMVAPLRRNPLGMHAGKDLAPILLIVLVIIIAYFLLGLLGQFHEVTYLMLNGLSFILAGESLPGLWRCLGAVVLGGLALVTTCIVVHVVFSWVGVYGYRLSRFVMRMSEPVLSPFRRMIPPVGVIDISPLIAIMILSLLSEAIRALMF